MIGANVLEAGDELCLARQTGAAPTCSPLAGTIEVRQLASDCYQHSSGITTCANSIDVSLHATSDWQGTAFTLDAEMLTVGSWVATDCE